MVSEVLLALLLIILTDCYKFHKWYLPGETIFCLFAYFPKCLLLGTEQFPVVKLITQILPQ